MSYRKSDGETAILRMNSELHQAHLELLSAHCATHQLGLRYSSRDLSRFGRPDILRKSAAAASALNHYYSALEKEIPKNQPEVSAIMQPTEEQIANAVRWLASYLQSQRELYYPRASVLVRKHKAMLSPYFSSALLERVRALELQGNRVSPPDFFARVRALGFHNLPEISHMESLSFLDVVVFNERLSERALFHALVHTVQIEVLGLERYCELWVRSFIKTRAHFTVPLEVHAFSLASRFVQPGLEKFSIEDEVMLWARLDRY